MITLTLFEVLTIIKPHQTRNVGQCPTWWPPCRIQVAPSVQRRSLAVQYESRVKNTEEITQRLAEFLQCTDTAFEWKMQFSRFPVLPGSAEAQFIWGGIVKRFLIISNISGKKYQNPFTWHVKVIASQRWDVFWDTVYIFYIFFCLSRFFIDILYGSHCPIEINRWAEYEAGTLALVWRGGALGRSWTSDREVAGSISSRLERTWCYQHSRDTDLPNHL